MRRTDGGETVLVTGGAGYIGSHAVLALIDAGFRCVVLDDLSTGHAESVPWGVPLVVANTADTRTVAEVMEAHRVSAVLHFAANLIAPESVENPLKYYDNNVSGSLGLIRACLQAGVGRMVFSSTAAVYGEPEIVPVPESAPTMPLNPYGASKLMTERVLRDVARAHGMDVAILRYFNVAGADPRGRTGQRTRNATHLIRSACDVALRTRPVLNIYGTDYPTPDGTCIRDYIHVSDLADAHVLALRRILAQGGLHTYNCGYGTGYSVRQVVSAVERITGRPLPVRESPRRPGDAARVIADPTALRRDLGWTPRQAGLDDIVATTIAWEDRVRAHAAA